MISTLRHSIGLFSGSLSLTLLFYGLTTDSFKVKAESSHSTHKTLYTQRSKSTFKGQEISLNGRKFPVAWYQWNQGPSIRTGIADTEAMQTLGLELLSSQVPNVQPVQWFAANPTQPIALQAQFISPYRYLDVTDLLKLAGAQIQVINNTLAINYPTANITNIRVGNQAWGKRIVIALDRPTFWQVSQAKNEGVVTIEGIANSSLLAQFQARITNSNNSQSNSENDDDPGVNSSLSSPQSNSQLLTLESTRTTTKLKINLPTTQGMKIFSLANPHRLVVDIRADNLVERQIIWAPGIIWHQQLLSLNQGSKQDLFPVFWLEIDPRSSHISLRPITSNANTLAGISPLVTMARSSQAVAAINGGFFNRNNQLPLGAIRQNTRWLSGPILNRGVIAWDNQGQFKFGRLSLRETLITANGNHLPILFLNSGYVQAGIARYTKEWGTNYTNLTDNETIIVVQDNRVIKQHKAGMTGKNSVSIPTEGYLLIIRGNNPSTSSLTIGTQITLESTSIPAEFGSYPHILGAGPLLIQNRQIVLNAEAEKFSQAFQQQTASRSAIALTDRGKLIIVAVHNRVGGKGATLTEHAQILQRLGAIEALNLDGGSSTSLYLGGQLIDRYPVTAARIHNGIGIFFAPIP